MALEQRDFSPRPRDVNLEPIPREGLSIGIYRPRRVVTNDELCAGDEVLRDKIVHSVGADRRYVAGPDETALMMVHQAAVLAGARDLDVVKVSVSHPDGRNNSLGLVRKLNLDPSKVDYLDYHLACSGVGEGFVDFYLDRDKMKGRRFFIGSSERYSETTNNKLDDALMCDGSIGATGVYGKDLEVLAAKSIDGPEELSGLIKMRVDRSLMVAPYKDIYIPYAQYFDQDGFNVRKTMEAMVPDEISNLMEEANLKPEEIDYVIPHQGSQLMVRSLDHRLKHQGFAGKVVYDNEEGNWSSG
ncbi:MAG TPA: hypothetical protein VG965_03965, partial [Patescibacteria group bacterium]|nr:hypothetical protein [Patescibacteria group bacterium]